MSLKTSFASVLKAVRQKRNVTQNDFADTASRTYLSKLELGKSSITLDKLEQLSRRLDLNPLTILALTLSEDSGEPAHALLLRVQAELAALQIDGITHGINEHTAQAKELGVLLRRKSHRASRLGAMPSPLQTEMSFAD
ncbi:helix-turn-helix transcriptional regulator [Pseudomonas sp. RC3H12]|uniref:helix-turn-helix domain-containing protein n=1 Tax=Pseudomonas sp. RC3H12 TaxID=2834406 RepID=UPI001BDDDBCD|nr:helix-turn-helix transcriptional regulator [Pseudomonas sp. RC3H12]QWA30534.1 helix-turn-helix domain-containing protein [Pseudomonas sp. RC3H12]